jgi:hypothetical protein
MAPLAVILQDRQDVFVKRRRRGRYRFLKNGTAKTDGQSHHSEQRDNPETHL